MITEGFDFFLFFGIALTLALLMARIARQKDSLFKGHRVPALKKCPKCAEELPISALLCKACDYNFLSRTVGHRHILLLPPIEARNGQAHGLKSPLREAVDNL
jgi:hypothetical protein